MKAVVLAGGTGTRLSPLTKVMNKHMLPVGNKPMIQYGIEMLKEAGITDILIILSPPFAGAFLAYLGSGSEWGVRLTYKLQDQAGGIAQALGLAEDYIGDGERFLMLLGDNLLEDPLLPFIEEYRRQPAGARVLLKEVDEPRRFGVPEIENGMIRRIEEKPAAPKSNYCVTGVYMYDSQVFGMIRQIAPSGRGELEITDVNNEYANRGQLTYSVLTGWWADAGTFESWLEANNRKSGERKA